MRIINKFLLLLAFTFTFVGCEDYIGGDINQDPNNPVAVPLTAQMPAFQIALADMYGGSFSRFNCMLTQQVEGVERQWSSFNQYSGLTPNRFDDAWDDTYENVLNEIQIAKTSAQEQGFNHYLGVLNVMEAFTLMVATDVWDDMPYTDALKGVASINPTFDTQASIYTALYALLDEAIALFNGPAGAVVPGSEDVFYGGDISLWEKAAHGIIARGKMKDNDYNKALSEAQASFTSSSENLGYQYPDLNAAGQWYRFNRDRTGDIEFNPTMRALMTELNDTVRLGVMDNTFIIDHPYMVADFFQELITFREVQFIIAEVDVRNNSGGTQAGYDAYLAGIKAGFEELGLDEAAYDAYVAQPEIGVGVGNLTLELVMTQKYIAMFLQPEVYSDWRRTGIPALSPVSGSTIPVRWHYGANEYLFNTNSPSETEVNIFTDKVGWNR